MPYRTTNNVTPTFSDFINSEAAAWAVSALFHADPVDVRQKVTSWSDFTSWALKARDSFTPGDLYESREAWVHHIRRGFRRWSSGEKALALGALFAVDYAWLADDLSTAEDEATGQRTSRAFQILQGASGRYAAAVAACVAQVDR